jgi:sodium-coupled monocarboxylate transporter 8/12
MGTWIYIGSKVYPPTNEHLNQLDTTTEFCIIGNDTMIVPKLMETGEDYPGIAENWYSVSYLFYSTVGLFTTLILGCLVSVAAKKFAENKSKTVQAWLL